MKRKQEIWKDIPDFEGMYQVSNQGRVRGLERWVGARNNKLRKMKPKFLNIWKNRQGYSAVTLSKNGKVKVFRINRLVAIVFIPNIFNFPEVNHIDEDKENNYNWNLEWCTSAYNKQHSMRLHRTDFQYGARNHNASKHNKRNRKRK